MCRESENQRIREERERERALKYGGSDRSVAPRWGSRPRAADGTRVCLCLSVLCIHHGSPGGGGGRPPPRGNSYFGECRTGTMRTGAPSEQPAPNRGSSRGRASATFPSVRPLVWRLQTRRPIADFLFHRNLNAKGATRETGNLIKASIWALLQSRALTTICVDEVPAPRSRPTTVRQGNGGL